MFFQVPKTRLTLHSRGSKGKEIKMGSKKVNTYWQRLPGLSSPPPRHTHTPGGSIGANVKKVLQEHSRKSQEAVKSQA